MIEPYYEDSGLTLIHGKCESVLLDFPDNHFDSVVCDPPYELTAGKKGGTGIASLNPNSPAGRSRIGTGFMGKAWDGTGIAFSVPMWTEVLRVLKPGGHLLAFGASRTYHRLTIAVEDAGFEIRDSIAWLYGSGFPKNDGVLKPAFEPIVVARKPVKGTVKANVLLHGVGTLNIAANRTPYLSEADKRPETRGVHSRVTPYEGLSESGGAFGGLPKGQPIAAADDAGRWPTNVLLDQSQADALDAQSGVTRSRIGKPRSASAGEGWGMTATGAEYDDEGGASRFFPTFRYEAKAPGSEKPDVDGTRHPTVKPLELMRWLVRLVTPSGGRVLDHFAGSGTTGEAALLEGAEVVLIEMEEAHLPLIIQRVSKPLQQSLFG